MDDVDDIVAGSLERAAGELIYIPGRLPESLLVASVRRGLAQDARVRLVDGAPVYRLPNWTRPPGGVDVVADLSDGSGRLGLEMKVGKPDESIWDAIKLADVQVFAPAVRAGYLISDAKWIDGAEGSSLFVRLPARTQSCRELIAESPAAWAGTMVGGNGIRPRTSVGAVELAWVWQAALARHPGRRLVAVRVRPDSAACRETYDAEGFPVGYEPPDGLRAKVRRADEHLARAATGTPEAGASTDPCHGYPWFERWTQQRIVAVLRVIASDNAARACLRRRLAVERGWNEHELRARFDPH